MARSEAMKRAQKKYESKKPAARTRASTKSAGKRFILRYSTKKDLSEYMVWIHNRLRELDKREKLGQ